MNVGTVNIALNLLGILLGGGALVGVLRYLNNRQSIRNADEADIRDHYAEELKGLRAKLAEQELGFQNLENHLREQLKRSDQRHEECETARDAARKEINLLHKQVRDHQAEIDGLKRQIVRYSAEGVIELSAPMPSEQIEDAAQRAIDALDKQENGDTPNK
jgi:predicted RNase H-like nuclease (RuvC/YqgF family)